jgi:YcxB-like protein
MNLNEIKTIHVDFEVNRRDLFRVNLDMAKGRLITALLVAAIPIVGLSYLFLLIDEGAMLLQLSPLLIGAPLLAVGGQVLRLHAACRKFVSQLPDSQRRFLYLFQAETDGFDRTYGESFNHVAWNDVLKAIEKPAYFVLYLNSFEARIVPKGGFHLSGDIPMLRSILRTRLGARANLFRQ